MKVKKLFEEKITDEMVQWFYQRTAKHIELVKKYCNILFVHSRDIGYQEAFKDLYKRGQEHDKSKYEEPEKTPYIKLSWLHKNDGYKNYKKPGDLDQKEINEATLHHIKTNRHHPEFWSPEIVDIINREDRDKPGRKIIDAKAMPIIDLAEMVADWLAMSEELGTSVKDWADKNIGVRWNFSDQQKELIYELIKVAE